MLLISFDLLGLDGLSMGVRVDHNILQNKLECMELHHTQEVLFNGSPQAQGSHMRYYFFGSYRTSASFSDVM